MSSNVFPFCHISLRTFLSIRCNRRRRCVYLSACVPCACVLQPANELLYKTQFRPSVKYYYNFRMRSDRPDRDNNFSFREPFIILVTFLGRAYGQNKLWTVGEIFVRLNDQRFETVLTAVFSFFFFSFLIFFFFLFSQSVTVPFEIETWDGQKSLLRICDVKIVFYLLLNLFIAAIKTQIYHLNWVCCDSLKIFSCVRGVKSVNSFSARIEELNFAPNCDSKIKNKKLLKQTKHSSQNTKIVSVFWEIHNESESTWNI